MKKDAVVIGAGFAGSVVAERLATAGHKVCIIERHMHIGGNSFDEYDGDGVLIHRYGPHIFHTNMEHVYEYLSRFTEWHPYEHRVLASVDDQLLPIPVNINTINQLYGLSLDEKGVVEYLDSVREHRDPIVSSEDMLLNSVGKDLYEKFFRGYTRKQWGVDASELCDSVAARVPVRTNNDDRYFTDKFQAMPARGYTCLFERMLDHPNIEVRLGVSYNRDMEFENAGVLVYTGTIDSYFDYCYGKLPYRSLHFDHEHLHDTEQFQPVAVINYPNDFAYTRITEYKHLTGQEHSGTSISREYPQAEGEPYYPIPCPQNEALYQKYKTLADQEEHVAFVGRLAEYCYYNIDRVVDAALNTANNIVSMSRMKG